MEKMVSQSIYPDIHRSPKMAHIWHVECAGRLWFDGGVEIEYQTRKPLTIYSPSAVKPARTMNLPPKFGSKNYFVLAGF